MQVVSSDRPQVIFASRPPGSPPELASFLAEKPEIEATWDSEALEGRAERALREFLEAFLEHPEQAMAARLPETFQATELRPAERETIRLVGSATVQRDKSIDGALREGEEARGALLALHGPFEGASGYRAEVDISRFFQGEVEDEGHRAFATEALIVLSGNRERERVQVSTRWRVSWRAGVGTALQVQGIQLLDYEEVELAGPLFSDLTTHVFGQHPFFQAEFLLGVDDYYNRMDRLVAPAFIGSQGLAVGDANGDGLDDVFVAQQDGLPNRLFLQQSDGRALDASGQAGVGFLDAVRSALFLDLDNDGDQDLALSYGANILILDNDGRAVFSNPRVLQTEGLNNVFSLCAADADLDGDLDIYACHYVLSSGENSTLPAPYYDANNGSANHYWRNEGDGTFTDATKEVGLDVNNRRFSFAAIWEDFDLDGDPDLYVTNDFGRNNLYRNDGGTFKDIAEEAGALDMAAGMGATVDDYDRDGDMDVYVSNMFMAEGSRILSQEELFAGGQAKQELTHFLHIARGNTLLRNRGDGTFEDATLEAGVWRGGWAWGATFGDFNNDGWSDLYVPNGFTTGWGDGDVDGYNWYSVASRSPRDGRVTEAYQKAWGAMEHMVMNEGASYSGNERNRVYMNTGDGRFADVGAASSVDFLEDSRAVGMLDWDDDGRLDVVMKNRTAPRLRLLRNEDRGTGDFLAVELIGVTCNRDAIGARVEVKLESGVTLRRTLHAGEGYIAQSSKRLHFGLGQAAKPVQLAVHWPDGKTDLYERVEPNRRYRATQGRADLERIEARHLPQLAQQATEHIEQPVGNGVERLVLVERLPLGPLEVPSFEDPERKVADFAGSPVLLHLWSSYCQACPEEFASFAQHEQALRDSGLYTVHLTVDDPEDRGVAQTMVEQLGSNRLAGYVDSSSLLALQVLFTAVFGHSMEVPLPSSLLVDEQGNLAAVYFGPVDVPQVLRDLQALAPPEPGSLSGEGLLGGSWLTPRTRNLKPIIRALRMSGKRALADSLRSVSRARKAPR